MTLLEILSLSRFLLDDVKKPYKWNDELLVMFANEAEEEACRRARLIVDTTSSMCRKRVSIGEEMVKLDPRVIFVRRAKLASSSVPLQKMHMADMDACNPGWESYLGLITHYIPDHTSGYLRLFRIPTSSDELTITVVRTPLNAMESMDNSPEIEPRYHRYLAHWIAHRAYLTPDAETFDENKAARELTLFANQFGQESTAVDEIWIAHQHGYDGSEGIY